ncbi:MAG: nitrate reductase cytochrome c-type subunit [Gammaproteobacteria bacterium]|nr:nitrate reductase cytochrome c-type subunit [Gammaproteobacteria bacterium]
MKKPMMLTLVIAFGAVIVQFTNSVLNANAADQVVQSLRGKVPIAEENGAPAMKQWQRDRDPIPRDYVQQPPLIPHKTDTYEITAKNNKCLSCHSWSRYKEVGATKISLTHFKDRAGTDMANVSPRRYFCDQCHVPQVDAKPLVENTFDPIQAVKQQ